MKFCLLGFCMLVASMATTSTVQIQGWNSTDCSGQVQQQWSFKSGACNSFKTYFSYKYTCDSRGRSVSYAFWNSSTDCSGDTWDSKTITTRECDNGNGGASTGAETPWLHSSDHSCLAAVQSSDNEALNFATDGEMIVSNLTETCLTVLGGAEDPFNVMNTQLCDSSLSSQRWIYDSSTGTICSGLNGYCLQSYAPNLYDDFLIVSPKLKSLWAFNQATGAIHDAKNCSCVLNIANGVTDGSWPIHVDSRSNCSSPYVNEQWYFKTPLP
jgi:hypothetical protein